MTDRWYNLSLSVAPPLVSGLMRLWFATCRVRVHGQENIDAMVREHRAGIAAFWHYSFLYLFYHLRPYPAAVMVSASRDGEYIARLAERFGHRPVRGSSNRRGVAALREIIELLRQGRNAGIVADGSQGPARKAQAGCILMAAKSGKPIIPMVWAASRFIAFHSWDRTVVPLPFSTIAIHHGDPLVVPPEPTPTQIEAYRMELEHRLNLLYDVAWSEVNRGRHDGDAM